MKQVAGIVVGVGVVVLIGIGLQMRTVDEQKPMTAGDAMSTVEAPATVEPFSFDRQKMGELVKAQPVRTPSSKRAKVGTRYTARLAKKSSEDRFAETLAQAKLETNAAAVYRLILDRMDEESVEGAKTQAAFRALEELMHKGDQSWTERYLNMSEEDNQKLLTLLRSPEITQMTALLHEAAAKEDCDFELDYSQGFSLLAPHLGLMRRLARLSSVNALASADWEDPAAALNSVEVGLNIGRHAGSDKLLTSQLVGIAADRLVLESLAGLAQQPELPSDHAYAVLVEMAQRDYVSEMSDAIKFEAEMMTETIGELFRNPDQLAMLGDEVPQDVKDRLNDDVNQSIKVYNEIAQRFVAVNDLPQTERAAALEAIEKELKTSLEAPDHYLARTLIPAYGATIRKANEAVAALDDVYVDVLTAVYRSQHGRDPKSLDDLQSIIDEAERFQAN